MEINPYMTRTIAHDLLRVPKFADPRQIAAVKYLDDTEEARGRIAKCKHAKCQFCEGTGTSRVGRPRELCEECGGYGTTWICRCFKGLSGYAVRDARLR